ncbi:hypothetical protein J7J41_02150 [bacterium]|nr:hypothetical protein [bacterium]
MRDIGVIDEMVVKIIKRGKLFKVKFASSGFNFLPGGKKIIFRGNIPGIFSLARVIGVLSGKKYKMERKNNVLVFKFF